MEQKHINRVEQYNKFNYNKEDPYDLYTEKINRGIMDFMKHDMKKDFITWKPDYGEWDNANGKINLLDVDDPVFNVDTAGGNY